MNRRDSSILRWLGILQQICEQRQKKERNSFNKKKKLPKRSHAVYILEWLFLTVGFFCFNADNFNSWINLTAGISIAYTTDKICNFSNKLLSMDWTESVNIAHAHVFKWIQKKNAYKLVSLSPALDYHLKKINKVYHLPHRLWAMDQSIQQFN